MLQAGLSTHLRQHDHALVVQPLHDAVTHLRSCARGGEELGGVPAQTRVMGLRWADMAVTLRWSRRRQQKGAHHHAVQGS